jgi:kynurenine formamidase
MHIPRYDELPQIEALGIRHAWDVFGPDDEFGTLNHLTDDRVRAATSEVRTGARIGLTLPMDAITPPLYGRQPLQHTLIEDSRNIWDDRLDSFYPQASSQWDGMRHVRCREFGFYGGVTESPPDMGEKRGIHHWARRGITGRGVLLDVAGYLATHDPSYQSTIERSVSPELLQAVADAQGVAISSGDILCIRFGWVQAYRRMSVEERASYAADSHPPYAGLAAGEEMARHLWDLQVAALVCDNPGAEVAPGSPEVGSLHRRLLPTLGLVIGELFDLDALAEAARSDGRWTFLFTAVPTHVVGGVGSPANAIAIR